MKTNTKVNGFPVIVHHGREITEAQYAALEPIEQSRCKRKVNGPHWQAKYAHGGYLPKRKSDVP